VLEKGNYLEHIFLRQSYNKYSSRSFLIILINFGLGLGLKSFQEYKSFPTFLISNTGVFN